MGFEGFFELNDARALFKKLERDYDRLKHNFLNQDAAFDFVITAYYLLEWAYPGATNSGKRSTLEKDTILLQVASHLANGAKHFRATLPKHKSVTDAEKRAGAFQSGAFQSDAFDVGELEVQLEGDAVTQLGKSIAVLSLAEKLLQFWRSELKI
jgi:hypothetical protein